MKLVEQIHTDEHRSDFKTRYIKYRAGRLKHQYWLWNRKRINKVVDQYDAQILKNCQPGSIAFFASSGYYLRDIWPQIDSIEMHGVVKEFYPDVVHVNSRAEIASTVQKTYKNFAVVNNRADHWVDVNGLTEHVKNYIKVFEPGTRFFYSFRDTQMHYNRLKINGPHHFLFWAQSLQSIGLNLAWHSVEFPAKHPDPTGNYDLHENPDTVNGNIKFWFSYQEQPWQIQQ